MNNLTWSSWGKSVIGPAHVKIGLVNQDAWLSKHYSWGDIVIVSDGLGSRDKSDIGAKAVCWSVVEAAKTYSKNPDSTINDLLRLIHSFWLMKIAPYSSYECSATCLFALRIKEQLIVAQLGDGLIFACNNEKTNTIILNDDKEESFSNLTFSLGAEFKQEQWQIKITKAVEYDAVILCSDGISDDLLAKNVENFCYELYLYYRNYPTRKRMNEINKWLINWPVPKHSDDKTIACLYKQEGKNNE